MATERRLLRGLAVVPVMAMLLMPVPVRAAAAWWQPLALSGERVDSVAVTTAGLLVHTAAGYQRSTDGGRSFGALAVAPPQSTAVDSGGVTWDIQGGTIVTGRTGTALHPDPGAPRARMLAAPAALPGVVVAVDGDDHVWRRSPSGSWALAFILLPAGGLAGPPAVTAVAAFSAPVTDAVYLGTAGYAVLLTSDGGDDWIRADPGLPATVLGLATDASRAAVYAATDQGLYVHHLQSFPAPPAYHDSALWLRWLGIALVSGMAALAAVLALRRLLSGSATTPAGT
jgi:hypothetical protein